MLCVCSTVFKKMWLQRFFTLSWSNCPNAVSCLCREMSNFTLVSRFLMECLFSIYSRILVIFSSEWVFWFSVYCNFSNFFSNGLNWWYLFAKFCMDLMRRCTESSKEISFLKVLDGFMFKIAKVFNSNGFFYFLKILIKPFIFISWEVTFWSTYS